jgi:CRP-like cAMP-binding protein
MSSLSKLKTQLADSTTRMSQSLTATWSRTKDQVEVARLRGRRPTVQEITPRLIAVWLPRAPKEQSAVHAELLATLAGRTSILIFNVSGTPLDAPTSAQFQNQLLEMPFALDHPPSIEPMLALCPAIESFLLRDAANVVVVQGMQDCWQTDMLVGAVLLFTRFTTDPNTALSFVAFRVAPHLYAPPPPSFARAMHFVSALMRREARVNDARVRLRFVIVHSVPVLDAAGGCRPHFEVLDENGDVKWCNAGGGGGAVPSAERLRALPHYSAARGHTSIPLQMEPAPLLDGDFTLRATHIGVVDDAVVARVPIFSAWHHTAFVDGIGLVVRLASSQFDVSEALQSEIDDEFALDLIFAAEDGARSAALRPQLLKLPTELDRCGECLFLAGESDVVAAKRAFAAHSEKELLQQAESEQASLAKRALKAKKESMRAERADPVAARLAARTRAARTLRQHYQKFMETFGLPVDEVPLGTFSCALVVPSGKPLPGTLFVSTNFLAFHGSLSKVDMVFNLREIVSLNDDNRSAIYRKCVNVTLADSVSHSFTWVERTHGNKAARIAVDAPPAVSAADADGVSETDDGADDDDDNDDSVLDGDAALSPLEQIDSLWRDCTASRQMRLAMGSNGALTAQRDFLTQRDLQILMLGATYRKFKRGQPLQLHGEALDVLLKISKGKAKAYVPAVAAAASQLSAPASGAATPKKPSSGATTPVGHAKGEKLQPKQLFRRLRQATGGASDDDSATAVAAASAGGDAARNDEGDGKLTDDEAGVRVGAIGEGNLVGEISYLLKEHVALTTVVADGTVEAHEIPFKYIDEQIRASSGLSDRLFRTMARSLTARLRGLSARLTALTLTSLRLHPERMTRSSTFDHAIFTPSMLARLPASDGRAVPPTACVWKEPSGLDVHGSMWATPACVCFTAELFGFATHQLLPIGKISAAQKRGGDEIELTLEQSARPFVMSGFAQRDTIVEALSRVVAAHRRATGRDLSTFGATDSDLTNEDWALLMAGARVETFRRGEPVVLQNSVSAAIYQVVSGRVLVVAESENKRLVVNVLDEGDLFGEMAFCAGAPAVASVYAETPEVALYVLDAAWLHATFTITPGLRTRFFRFVAVALAKRVQASAAALASELALPDNAPAVVEAAEKRLEQRHEKVIKAFYAKAPLDNGTRWPTIVFGCACSLERRDHSYAGNVYVSWSTALYFRSDKSSFGGKAVLVTVDYARIEAVRVVGDLESDRRTVEFEVRPEPSALAAVLAGALGPGDAAAPAAAAESAERVCLTFATIEERRTFWDTFHKFCPKYGSAEALTAEAHERASQHVARRRSSVDVARRRSSADDEGGDGGGGGDRGGGGGGATGAATGDDELTTTLTASEWQFLMSTVRVESFGAGRELLRGGESAALVPHRLFQIVSGQVKAVRANARARQQAVLGVQKAGAILGELTMLLGGAPLASVVVDSAAGVLAYTIDAMALRELLSLRPALAAAFDRKLLAAMARRLAFSYSAMALRTTLPLEPLVSAVVLEGQLLRRGKAKWKSVRLALHSDAFLSESAALTSSAAAKDSKLINLNGYAVERANVKAREHAFRLSHPVQRAFVLQAASRDECDAWMSALRKTIAEASIAQRQGVTMASRRKTDVKFHERFNVPQTETVVAEFECSMRVEHARAQQQRRRARSDSAAADVAHALAALPAGDVPATVQISTNYVGVHSKKCKYVNAVYMHGVADEPELDDESATVSWSTGALEFQWTAFATPGDAARMHETLVAYIALGADKHGATVPGQRSELAHFSSDDWTHVVDACDAKQRVLDNGTVVVRQGHAVDALYLLDQGRLRVVMTPPNGKSVQVACVEEGELFGAECFFGVSGADFLQQSVDWSNAAALLASDKSRSGLVSSLRSTVRRHKKRASGDFGDKGDDGGGGGGGGAELGSTSPYSIVTDSARAVVTVVGGGELRSLLRLDPALRQKLLRHAAVGLARRVRAASTLSLDQTMLALDAEKK